MTMLGHSAAYWFLLWCVMTFSFLVMTWNSWRLLKMVRKQGELIDDMLKVMRLRTDASTAVIRLRRARIDN